MAAIGSAAGEIAKAILLGPSSTRKVILSPASATPDQSCARISSCPSLEMKSSSIVPLSPATEKTVALEKRIV